MQDDAASKLAYLDDAISRLAYLLIVAPDGRIIVQRQKKEGTNFNFSHRWRATLGGNINSTNTSKNELIYLLYIHFNVKVANIKDCKFTYVGCHYITSYTSMDVYILNISSPIRLMPNRGTLIKLEPYGKIFEEATCLDNFDKVYTSDTTIAMNLINRTLGGIKSG